MSTKTRIIISWILSSLLALAFIGSGMSKLAGVDMQIKNLESWGYPLWFRFPIGLSEIILAIGLLIPRYRTLTLYGVFIWTVVAMITHLQAGQAAMMGAPALFGVLALIDLFIWRKVAGSSTKNGVLS